ncbi:hypothetical protein CC2G_010186 [Coprinopsis cinerea AmutBmut pab1-1]|nr:hypothetical protein CC2G_010186 [Coprinopsis cinerea AmutBmut pab1-1]
MSGLAESNEPAYISSHSADVILSDIRPFKLKPDALRCINALLDEFLHNVLHASGSLSTDRLRAALLGLLPTSLGKEALLEAEVELRAYWERTAPAGIIPPLEDDTATFHLPWAYELLRNKCEAYSTLNEADEDPLAETRINDKFSRSGASPPKVLLVAPAALYLTAILEAVCEHILSNVGRVAARDSSRTSATTNDLFTALCEDASVYGYFRTMKVYDQIEQLTKAPKSRRTPSIAHKRSGSVSRQSSDASSMNGGSAPPPRSSFDKARALRMFTNGKTSLEKEESHSGHKKSASLVSDGGKNGSLLESDIPSAEDAVMAAEFDDLMRSSATMKMSLTPDRLKTMEVYKQEKQQRGTRRPAPLAFKPEPEPVQPPSRTPSSRPSLRHVDSIIEDEEENTSPKQPAQITRTRQASVASTPAAPFPAPNGVRTRSISTSGAVVNQQSRKLVRSPPGAVPSAFPSKASTLTTSTSASNLNTAYNRSAPIHKPANGMPARTRVRQRNRESLDLDDVMGGSDDETIPEHSLQARAPTSPKRTPKVSSTTRELIDFLAEGPPDSRPPGPVSREGRQLADFLAEGPPNYGGSVVSLENKPKTGRLQRMISKLNIGEKGKVPDSPAKTQTRSSTSGFSGQVSPPPNPLASLANRPIPPRPPRPPQPISPPSSPSQVSLSQSQENSMKPPSRKPSGSISQENRPIGEKISSAPPPVATTTYTAPQPLKDVSSPSRSNATHINGSGPAVPRSDYTKEAPAPDTHVAPKPAPTIHRKPAPPVSSISNPASSSLPPQVEAKTQGPSISENDARDMHRLISNATTIDECRLIVDMFLTRAGISRAADAKPADTEAPYPSPPPSMSKCPQAAATGSTISDRSVENSVVDLLLGSSNQSGASTPPTRPPRRHPRPSKPEPVPSHNVNGHPHANLAHVHHERSIPIATWKSPAEFPTHATGSALVA